MDKGKTAKLSRKNVLVIVFALVFAVSSGVITHDWLLGSAILFCGLISAYLASIGKRANYVFGLLGYLLMGYVAFKNHLYGTGSFYVAVCAPLQVHGFYNWGKNLDGDNVKVRKFSMRTSVIAITACLAGSAVVGFLLGLIPSQQLNFLDAASNCVNLCGIILMNLRYMEAWWLWLVNNVLDFAIWGYILLAGTGNQNTVMMFITCIMYLVVNLYGIYKWMRETSSAKARQ